MKPLDIGHRPTLYLCGGTQSSGSTIISWCFLQRPDMDGILDARSDVLPAIPGRLSAPLPWIKFTISSFRFSEVESHFQSEGWDVRPLLIVRDVRAVFNSLIKKDYGRNGTTSDDPPLRLRMSRFLDDWRLFRDRGWPIIRFEKFACDPRSTLQEACSKMGLPWMQAMIDWAKQPEQISDASFGNQTFLLSRGQSLTQTLKPSMAAVSTNNIPGQDLEWLEQQFTDFNAAMGYPAHIYQGRNNAGVGRAVPRYENTRSYDRSQRNNQKVHQALTVALQYRSAGRLDEAQSLCRQILTNVPNHNEALRLLATIARDRGDPEPLMLIARAEHFATGTAENHHLFGLILTRLGFPDAAMAVLRQAVALRPDSAEYRKDLAVALAHLGSNLGARAIAGR